MIARKIVKARRAQRLVQSKLIRQKKKSRKVRKAGSVFFSLARAKREIEVLTEAWKKWEDPVVLAQARKEWHANPKSRKHILSYPCLEHETVIVYTRDLYPRPGWRHLFEVPLQSQYFSNVDLQTAFDGIAPLVERTMTERMQRPIVCRLKFTFEEVTKVAQEMPVGRAKIFLMELLTPDGNPYKFR